MGQRTGGLVRMRVCECCGRDRPTKVRAGRLFICPECEPPVDDTRVERVVAVNGIEAENEEYIVTVPK